MVEIEKIQRLKEIAYPRFVQLAKQNIRAAQTGKEVMDPRSDAFLISKVRKWQKESGLLPLPGGDDVYFRLAIESMESWLFASKNAALLVPPSKLEPMEAFLERMKAFYLEVAGEVKQ